MIMRRDIVGLAIAALLAPEGLWAQSLTLGAGEVLKGRFAQQRFLQGFDAPLNSTGSFILAPHRGLVWSSETPFALVTVMGPGGLVQRVVGGATTRYPSSRLPLLAQLYEVFSAALSGDWEKLDTLFNVKRTSSGNGWEITLTPHRSDSRLPLSYVQVRGDHYVDAVEVMRVNGDRDRMEFSQQTPSHEPIVGEASELLSMVTRP
jgi:hypothetical protein